ncbi:MAG TPA: hypothetical protein VGB76_06130 [Pyrinomonadaceae bacterium]
MNRRILASLGIVLCAVIASAGALAMKKRTTSKPRPTTAAPATSTNTSRQGETLVISPAGERQQQPQPQANVPEPQANVPEHVVYWHIFHHHNFLNRKADEAQRMGKAEEATRLRGFYKREAKLDEGQDAALGQIALEVENEVEVLDAQAKRVIDAAREKTPGGALKKDEAIPPPPRELAALQERRNAAILKARNRLKSMLGDAAFDEFQGFVREKVAPQIKQKPFDVPRPDAPAGGRRQPRNNPYEGRTR